MAPSNILTIPACSILKQPVEISFATDSSYFSKHFTPKETKAFQKLFSLAQSEPAKALEQLIDFAKRHPQAPMISNLLAFCHLQLKDITSAEKVIEEAFLQFPSYFIAKINYADLLLRRKKWKQLPLVFGGKLDLSELDPSRKTFHCSEVRGFMTTLGYYYHEIGKRKLALEAFRIAVQAEPSHPSVAALEKKLFYQPLFRAVKFFLRKIFYRF